MVNAYNYAHKQININTLLTNIINNAKNNSFDNRYHGIVSNVMNRLIMYDVYWEILEEPTLIMHPMYRVSTKHFPINNGIIYQDWQSIPMIVDYDENKVFWLSASKIATMTEEQLLALLMQFLKSSARSAKQKFFANYKEHWLCLEEEFGA